VIVLTVILKKLIQNATSLRSMISMKILFQWDIPIVEMSVESVKELTTNLWRQ